MTLATARPTSASAPAKGSGMQLGKSTKTNQFLESLKAEGEVIVEDVAPGPARAAAVPVSSDPITVGVEEKLVVQLKKDGGVENLEVQGSMSLVVQKEEDAYIRVQVNPHFDINDFLFHIILVMMKQFLYVLMDVALW